MEAGGNYIYIPDDYYLNPDFLVIPKKYTGYLETILIPSGTIRDRTKQLARDLTSIFPTESLTFICVLRGAFRFFKDLVHYANKESVSETCNHNIEFIRARSYLNESQTEVQIEGLDSIEIENKNVVIVEDMVDRGKTLAGVSEIIQKRNPKSLKICVLSYKRNPLNTYVVPDYIGFSLPDKWIVGYNIDYNDNFRDLAHIAVINDAAKVKFRV